MCIRPNKKVCGNGSEIFKVRYAHILFFHFFFIFFFEKKNMHFERPFKMHKILFFPENLKKIIGFTSKFR